MNETTPPPSEYSLKLEAQKLARASDFREVFGSPKTRTPAQNRVLEYLETGADDDSNSYDFRGGADGISLIAAGIHRDGAKSIFRIIKRNISYADQKAKTPKVKAESKR